MSSLESFPDKEKNSRLQEILKEYGSVSVIDHKGKTQPLSQAVDECPPFVDALLNAETPELLQQIVDALKAP